MAEFYRQFALVSSVLAGFAFTFYGTLLVAAREHRAGAWAAFFSVAASVAFLPVTLGMTFGTVRAADEPRELSVSNLETDSQTRCFRCCSSPVWHFSWRASASAAGCVRVI